MKEGVTDHLLLPLLSDDLPVHHGHKHADPSLKAVDAKQIKAAL